MELTFDVKSISLSDFNKLKWDESDPPERRGWNEHIRYDHGDRMYVRVMNPIVFPSLEGLLSRSQEGVHFHHYVLLIGWQVSQMEAESMVRDKHDVYISSLIRQAEEQDLRHVIISLGKKNSEGGISKRGLHGKNNDVFKFSRREEGWTLRDFWIRRENLKNYRFKGLELKEDIPRYALLGVYSKAGPDASLECGPNIHYASSAHP